MPKVTISYEFSSEEEARNFFDLSSGGAHGTTARAAPSNPTGAPAPIPPQGNVASLSSPPPGGVSVGPPPPGVGGPPTPPPPAASPPPTAPPPAAPPPAPSAPPPAPPPAPAPSGGLKAEVLAAMQNWSKAGHKAAGIKRVLTKAGIASVSDQTPPATLEWLKWAFAPQPDGSFLTPEYIESL